MMLWSCWIDQRQKRTPPAKLKMKRANECAVIIRFPRTELVDKTMAPWRESSAAQHIRDGNGMIGIWLSTGPFS
jgi:hypothetical protein